MKFGTYDRQTKLNKCFKQHFQIANRLTVTAIQIWWQGRKVLSYPLTYHNQTWYIESWHHPGDTKKGDLWPLGGAVFKLLSLHMCGFQTYFQCLVILSDLPIQLLNDNSRKHLNLAAILKVVKITLYIFTDHKFCPIFFMWNLLKVLRAMCLT